jgi:hypothetical protein
MESSVVTRLRAELASIDLEHSPTEQQQQQQPLAHAEAVGAATADESLYAHACGLNAGRRPLDTSKGFTATEAVEAKAGDNSPSAVADADVDADADAAFDPYEDIDQLMRRARTCGAAAAAATAAVVARPAAATSPAVSTFSPRLTGADDSGVDADVDDGLVRSIDSHRYTAGAPYTSTYTRSSGSAYQIKGAAASKGVNPYLADYLTPRSLALAHTPGDGSGSNPVSARYFSERTGISSDSDLDSPATAALMARLAGPSAGAVVRGGSGGSTYGVNGSGRAPGFVASPRIGGVDSDLESPTAAMRAHVQRHSTSNAHAHARNGYGYTRAGGAGAGLVDVERVIVAADAGLHHRHSSDDDDDDDGDARGDGTFIRAELAHGLTSPVAAGGSGLVSPLLASGLASPLDALSPLSPRSPL